MAFKVGYRFVVCCVCCAQMTIVIAQQGEIVSKHFTMRDGLPDQAIQDIIQDRNGFIWLGTYSGLSKFDGYTFTNFRNNPVSANSLTTNKINELFEDSSGQLWIGHTQGLDLFDPLTERFILHWPDSGELNIQVLRLRERKDGKLWIATSNGIYVANTETLSIEKFQKHSRWTWDIAELANGSLVSTGGFYYKNATTRQTNQSVLESQSSKNIAPNLFSFRILIDNRERIWVGSYSGLELFNPRDTSFTHFASGLDIREMFLETDGKILLGTSTGLFEFDPDSGNCDTLINCSIIPAIMRDRQGVTWIATLDGLLQLNPAKKKFNILASEYMIGSLVEDANQHIWMLGARAHSRKTAVFKLNLNTSGKNVVEYQKMDYPENPLKPVRSLFLDGDGNAWRASPGRVEKITNENEAVDSRAFYEPLNTFVDSFGTIWNASWDQLIKYNPETKTGHVIEAFPSAIVYSFHEDLNHNLWIGSTAGLARYNLKTEQLDVFKNYPSDHQSLSNNVVFNVMQDKNGTIWVGTGGGLNKMIKGSENGTPRFVNWRTGLSGLPNDDVYCIVEGGDGTLWISCGNRISHFFPKTNVFKNYDQSDGLLIENFRGASYLAGKGMRSSSGYFLFGSSSGLVVFHPDGLADNPFVPPISITRFLIDNKPLPIRGTDADTVSVESAISRNIAHAREIELNYRQNNFTFEFSALNYVNPESNQYKYKLEPYEKEWINTDAENRVARYTNIDPGTYTFTVIGSNDDGLWNIEGAKLTIIITPPWWRTWWAYTFYALAIVATFIYWRNYEIRRLRLKHQVDHLRELDILKARFFTNISHEFRTPITLIQGPLKEMYDKAVNKEERSTVGIMLRNAQRLSKLINQLLDLSKLEAGKMTLHACKIELVQFLREMASSYESLAANKNIKYFFYAEVSELMVYIDVEKMEKVVHNLLSNAFKFTSEGEIALHLKTDVKQCIITVKDTGIGIPADQLDKVFDRFYQVDSSQTRSYEGSGLGMALAKELVELHHGTIKVESIVGKSTAFTVSLRLGKDHLNASEIIEGEDRPKSKPSIVETFMSPDNGVDVKTIESSEQPILLIVEDNADMRHYIHKTFSDNYQIIEAVNGKDGLSKAEDVIPDLIISDVMMPEMDGYKFCEYVKSNEKTSHVPVILLTAKADSKSKIAGLETGADDYLSKPFDAEEIKLIVKNRIEQRRKIRERFSRVITLEPQEISITSFDEKFLNKVMAVIEERMSDENFSIDELGRLAGYSNMHFYRKIKALSGATPSQFLRTIRLKRAAELLKAKSDNVTQIAYSVGFNSLSYFNKCFKEQFGVTPGQFTKEPLKFGE